MADMAVVPEVIDRLREPWRWDDLENESPAQAAIKIRQANELGAPAVLFTQQQVDTRIEQMALLEHKQGITEDTLYVVLLRGGAPFAGKFFSSLAALQPNCNPEVDYIQVGRFGEGQEGGELVLKRGLDPKTIVEGKSVVLVDDVIDNGITIDTTAEFFYDGLVQKGQTPKSVGIRALADKNIAQLKNFDKNSVHIGLTIPEAWGSGMGMDGLGEVMRWIPEVVLSPVQHEKYRPILPGIIETLGERAVQGMSGIKKWVNH